MDTEDAEFEKQVDLRIAMRDDARRFESWMKAGVVFVVLGLIPVGLMMTHMDSVVDFLRSLN